MTQEQKRAEQELRSLDAELDAIADHQSRQLARLEANWPADALRRKEVEHLIRLQHALAFAYWANERNQAALTLLMLSEVPIQCKAANISPTAFMNAGTEPQRKH